MARTGFLAQLDSLIARYDLLKHPFYQAWARGDLSLDALQHYACEYFRHVLAFPTYVSGVHNRIQELADRQIMLENLMEEESGPENHPELWLQFASGIGLGRSRVMRHSPSPAARAFVRAFQRATRNADPLVGLSALYAYESQIPRVAREKIVGLRKYFGIRDRETLKFFTVHQAADVKHSRTERQLLRKYSARGNAGHALRETEGVLRALWRLLSAVYGSMKTAA